MKKRDFLNWIIPAVISLTSLFPTEVVGCRFPSGFLHGTVIYENERHQQIYVEAPENYVLQFRCDKDYQLRGSRFIFCVSGNWTDVFPQCIELHCRAPPSIDNGTFTVIGEAKHAFVGSTVKYSCSKGFELQNENVNSLTCELNGTSPIWAGELPKCKETDVCPDPGKSRNGRREGNCCFKGDVLKFYCDDKYETVGQHEIVCLAGGSWSAPRPRCRPPGVVCPDPPDLSNGIIESDSTTDFFIPGNEVIIFCDEGYSVRNGSDQLYCKSDGTWDSVLGRCAEVSCQYPEIPSHGRIPELKSRNETAFPYGFHLTYQCDERFRLSGTKWNTCKKGRWAFETPKCEIIKCYVPGTPEGGLRTGSNFEIGSKVSYTCFSGYTLLGSVERYCLKNGQWSGELTRCDLERNHCPDPGIPINGLKTGSMYDKGDVVTYKCNAGFFLVGSDARVCQSNGSWTGVEPKCLGPYDFDNTADVSERLKFILQETIELQEHELELYRNSLLKLTTRTDFSSLEELEMAVTRTRIIDLNFPGRIILYFIFDTSGSIGEQNFRTSVEFVKALVKKIGITPAGARAGALSFSSTAVVQFLPMELDTTEAVIEALDIISYTSGGTATSFALQKLLTDIIPLTREILGLKTKSVVFILTDGKYNIGGNPESVAEELKSAGVEIFSVGITGSLRTVSLYETVSSPTAEHVFILKDYNAMSYLIQDIINGTVDYSECGLGLEKVRDRHERQQFRVSQALEPWPWMASLSFINPSRESHEAQHQCGGSVVGRKWVLTAAHCVIEFPSKALRNPKTVIVKLGLTDLKNESTVLVCQPEEIKLHGRYDPVTYDYDIALIKLNILIDFSDYIRPICLPSQELPTDTSLYKPGENAFVTGWGRTRKRGRDDMRNLKEIIVPIQSQSRCRSSLTDKPYNFTDQMFCAGTGLGDDELCAGVSGAPIMQSQQNGEGNVHWVQIGIASWGLGCSIIGQYGFYTHVQRLRSWILETMKTN